MDETKRHSTVENKPSKKVLQEIENIEGGVMGAKSGCDLSGNRKQIYNVKNTSRSDPGGVHVRAHVINICKDSFGTQDAFVR